MKFYPSIAGIAKSFYTKKVLIYGSESCGKTVLTQDLARIFNTGFSLEYYKE